MRSNAERSPNAVLDNAAHDLPSDTSQTHIKALRSNPTCPPLFRIPIAGENA